MTLLDNLENYYQERGILARGFDCKHECDCRKRERGQGEYPLLPKDTTAWSKETECKFTPARSAYVGRLYGVPKGLPRLMFLSLDPGSALVKRDPEFNIASDQSRLPKEVREGFEARMERVRASRSKATPTLRGMNLLALRVLGEFPECPADNPVDVARYYAHVNAVKCSLNLPSRRKVPARMFRNCRGYLPREIGLLEPQVVVTMGDDAKDSAKHVFNGPVPDDGIVTLDGRGVFWIHSPHPAVRDGSFKKFMQEGIGPAIERLRGFISNSDSRI